MLNKEQLVAIKERVESANKRGDIAVQVYEEDAPALIEEVERLQQFEQKAIYVLEENKLLREALEFYADEENYEWHEINDLETMPGDVLNDNGKKARQALGDGDE